ncbi:hypothetical protein ES332_A11G202300v1 [Gossypium tomentosum]|uniref:Uncharacterized protein n=1 Tax=Gossypium tomentosum TaxID=34277 RepID=A0A5D2NGT0_GOSTO|nr:hypothetical protein ES332_A11G202300v1 [Gossypium tomentosum]
MAEEGRGAADMARPFVGCTEERGCTYDVARPLVKAAAQRNPRVPEVSICSGHLGRFKIGHYCKMSLKFGLQLYVGQM